MRSLRTIFAALSGVLLAGATPAAAAPFFAVLPTDMRFTLGLSGDGVYAVGFGGNPSDANRWSAAGGTEPLGGDSGRGYDASGDGSVVVGSSRFDGVPGTRAFRWTAAGGIQMLPEASGFRLTRAYGTSGNGDVAVGAATDFTTDQAFRWEVSGTLFLGDLSGGDVESEAYGVSADGSKVVGRGQRGVRNDTFEAFLWTAGSGMVGLGFLPGATFTSEANAISADGTTVVGFSRNAADQFEAFRWTEGGGMEGLGTISGRTEALAVSGDGSRIVGRYSEGLDAAWIWDAANGGQKLQEVLEIGYGLDLGPWELRSVFGISDDGLKITGEAWDPATQEFRTWYAELGSTLPFVPEPSRSGLLIVAAAALAALRRQPQGSSSN